MVPVICFLNHQVVTAICCLLESGRYLWTYGKLSIERMIGHALVVFDPSTMEVRKDTDSSFVGQGRTGNENEMHKIIL